MPTLVSRLCLVICVSGFVSGGWCPRSALGADRAWVATDGHWSLPANWLPFGVPGPGDVARIGTVPTTGTVDLNVNAAVTGVEVSDGMTLNLSENTLTVLDQMEVTSSSKLEGSGIINFLSGGPGAAFRMDGVLAASSSGGIVLNQIGAGRLDLDGLFGQGTVRATSYFVDGSGFSSVTVNGDGLHDEFNGQLTIIKGAEINMNLAEDWTLAAGGRLTFFGSDLAAPPAELNGSDVTLAGEITTIFPSVSGRINANADLAETLQVDLNDGAEVEFHGDTVIHGGAYQLGQDAQLNFQGNTVVRGGIFDTPSSDPTDGVVRFAGPTTWAGDTIINGAGRQNGDATVTSPTTIQAGTFDMDGAFGTAEWHINHSLAVQADSIDAVSNEFNGVLQFGSNLLSGLSIELPAPADTWQMNGVTNLTGNAVFSITRISGNGVEMNGTVNVSSSKVGIAADTVFGGASSTVFDSASSELTMHNHTEIEAGAMFQGSGTLINGNSGNMLIRSGADVNVDVLNRGRLQVGEVHVKRLEQADTGTIEFEIAGTTPGLEHGQLISNSSVTLQGGTLEILPVAPYIDPAAPGSFDEFTLITANWISGEFDMVTYDGVALDWDFTSADSYRSHEGMGLFRLVEYNTDELSLVNYRALPGDANGDGTVDGGDFVIWNSHKFSSGTDWTTGDFNGDGVTDGQDFVLWNSHKFTSVGAFDRHVVPEPPGGLLVCYSCLAGWLMRRSGRGSTLSRRAA
ncbi:MAG: dockerin type I repeat-containing protein [Planctomycetota bacterium]